MKRSIIQNFKMIIDVKYVSVILDSDENLVAFAVMFPSIAKAVQKSRGRLTPGCIFRILRAVKNRK